jgi:hypothetical protein
MSHDYTAKFAKVGYKVISSLVKEGGGHVNKTVAALALSKAMGKALDDYYSEADIETAVRAGAFNAKGQVFGDVRGRYGSIRNFTADEAKAANPSKKIVAKAAPKAKKAPKPAADPNAPKRGRGRPKGSGKKTPAPVVTEPVVETPILSVDTQELPPVEVAGLTNPPPVELEQVANATV